jgi:hypothetical protein
MAIVPSSWTDGYEKYPMIVKNERFSGKMNAGRLQGNHPALFLDCR